VVKQLIDSVARRRLRVALRDFSDDRVSFLAPGQRLLGRKKPSKTAAQMAFIEISLKGNSIPGCMT
jgi:hypothetical protein